MANWLPLNAAILHCSDTFILAFIVTPKSFSVTVLRRVVPPIYLFMAAFPSPACRYLNFQKIEHLPFLFSQK